ncbi:hypothetical protein Pla22_13400 [Rubripirellula amarantea]|uniref:Uncharacterized protein n=2 Tax=Rubripirellula amarantea TaxID=2527999 RepID=A0A5C5WT55_9BACT|nr:hypothetical protein Pla22_13400 [Rubripirellula amarantea]
MWHSSRGNRTLQDAEALLVASAIDMMIDALAVHVDDDDELNDSLSDSDLAIPDCESGILIFDRLGACQRIAVLHQIATYLLTDTSQPLKLTAILEAGVAAVYVEIRDQLAIEIDLCDELNVGDAYTWRAMVRESLLELANRDDEDVDLPPLRSEDLPRWEDVVDILATAVLWDRDFEMTDGFLDEDPYISSHRRKLLGIDHDYFTDVPQDPKPEVAHRLIRETRGLLRLRAR